jgi:hypothetical protein
MTNIAFWLPALTGGLAGAFLTLFGNRLISWRNRPIIEVVFDNEEPGCSVATPAWLVDRKGEVLTDERGNPRTMQQHYLRLKIKNVGNSAAKDVSVCVLHIAYRAGGTGERTFAEEVFDLKLSLTGDRSVFNLASRGHRFVDFVHVQQEGKRSTELAFDFVKGALRLTEMGFGRGAYEMKAFVSAENAGSIERDLRWSWNGTLGTLKCG